MSMHKFLLASSILCPMLVTPVAATVHLFHIEELYSTPSGTLQFIELDTDFNNQNLFKTGGNNGRLISKTAGNDVHATYFFPNDLPSTSTAGHSVLVGTANVLAIGGVTPDFIMPDNFLLLDGGILEFVSDVFGTFNTVTYPALPSGKDSYDAQAVTTGLNTPRNFAGVVGQVPEPSSIVLAALSLAGAWGLFGRRGRRR
jgi:hypothetical protein